MSKDQGQPVLYETLTCMKLLPDADEHQKVKQKFNFFYWILMYG